MLATAKAASPRTQKCLKLHGTSGFRHYGTNGHCIKDGVNIDPCMGSGHILVYAFEVFMQLYLEQGYDEREAAETILTNNLYGLDIDRRAFQLAYFALFMKAREYNRRILSKGIELNICAIEESNGLETAIEELHIPADSLVARTVKAFADAKEYGSILNIPAEDYGEVREYVQALDEGSNLFMSAAVGELKRRVPALVKQAAIMSRKYEVVVTNPPYMGGGMSTKLSDFVKKHYKDSKSDLFAVFIEKCADYTQQNGYQAMLTQHAWMFLSSYVKLREKIQKKTIINMAHLGPRAFEEIGGEVVQTTSWVMLNEDMANYKGTYTRLTEPTNQQGKADLFLSGEKRYLALKRNFEKIPESPVAYWLSEKLVEPYSNDVVLMGKEASPCAGLATGDNDIFQRNWHEVDYNNIGYGVRSAEETINRKEKWYPCNSGGEFRKWYPADIVVVDWFNNGDVLKKFRNKRGKLAARPQNTQWYFKEGLTWNKLSSSRFAVRYKREGFIFDDTSRSAFPNHVEKLKYYIGLLCSCVTLTYLKALNPTMSFTNGDIARIPLLSSNKELDVEKYVEQNIALSKADWDSIENSWDFQYHPLLQRISRLQSAYDKYKVEVNARFDKLKANEEELNRIFIDIYGLGDELTPEVADKDVTVARVYDTKEEIPDSIKGNNYVLTKSDVVKSLLSYAVGCMFGRYSLDMDGLAYAGGEWDESRYSTFYPDADNIIPITDEAYSEDDIVDFFVAWMKKAFGVENLEENLAFIADALGTKGTGSRDRIRAYFLKDFYKDHVKTYKKRPIYWLYDSGKQNGFKALVYMHRYDEDTTGRVRADYLHRIERIYETEIARMTEDIEHSDNAREIGKATKRREKLQKQLKECQAYDEQIAAPALARIAIDLDDGVKVNYNKVQTVEGRTYNMLAKI